MRMVLVPLVALMLSCVSSPSQREQTMRPAELECEVAARHPASSALPLSSVATCSDRRASAADLIKPRRESLFAAKVSIALVDARGPRALSGIERELHQAQVLMNLCYRKWIVDESGDSFAVVATIQASGRVRAVRTERKDGLGRCVAEVFGALEFAPQGLDDASTDVLANVAFRPSPWTMWASK